MTTGASDPASMRVTLITRVGCHLCEDARSVLSEVCGPRGIGVDVLDVDTDPELRAEYGDLVPVVLVDGREHAHFRVDAAALVRALGG